MLYSNIDQRILIDKYSGRRISDDINPMWREVMGLEELGLRTQEESLDIMRDYYPEYPFSLVESGFATNEVIALFDGMNYVPVLQDSTDTLTVLALPELDGDIGTLRFKIPYEVNILYVTPFAFFYWYHKIFGHKHKYAMNMPAKDFLDMVIEEAILFDAADITISTEYDEHVLLLQYNVKKKQVFSEIKVPEAAIEGLIKILSVSDPYDDTSMEPLSVLYEHNQDYNLRVCINNKNPGYMITSRLLPNENFTLTMNDINLPEVYQEHLHRWYLDGENGIRIIAGATFSGKNTTTLTCLHTQAILNKYKIVEVGNPIELRLKGVEQISCSKNDYASSVDSLIRVNPDLVYITEMGSNTASPIIRVSNTGKRVLTTLHANSCHDVIGRIIQLCGTDFTLDEIVSQLHTIIFQDLTNDNGTLKVTGAYIEMTNELKLQLYGKSIGECMVLLMKHEITF